MLSCKQLSCAEDAHVRSYARRYGPASDAEFLRSIADKTPGRDELDGARQMRHLYLKSYVFVTKDDDDANYAIMDKTRRVVVGALSKYLRRPTMSAVRSLLLSRFRFLACSCTGGSGRHGLGDRN